MERSPALISSWHLLSKIFLRLSEQTNALETASRREAGNRRLTLDFGALH
jgi:hypothetical protein